MPVRELLARRWAAFLVDGRAAGEAEVLRPDGSSVGIRFTGVARVAPGRNLGVIRAVTERADEQGPRHVRFGPLLRGEQRGARAALSGARVLIVDGDATSRGTLVRHLTSLGMAVRAAPDGQSALAELRAAARVSRRYDVALVDFAMPGARGWVVRAIGSEPLPSQPAIVMITSAADRQAAAGILEADGFVTKPIETGRLTDELVRVIAPRRGGVTRSVPHHLQPGAPNGRVLVAEDDPVSQSVAVGLLTSRGFEVELAGDGQALAMHSRAPYDAIFIGCPLPLLDGVAATREIRRREGGGAHTPIIAMTATRLHGDTERCIAAGVDYCSGRPISAAGLDYVLGRAFHHATPPGRAQATPPPR